MEGYVENAFHFCSKLRNIRLVFGELMYFPADLKAVGVTKSTQKELPSVEILPAITSNSLYDFFATFTGTSRVIWNPFCFSVQLIGRRCSRYSSRTSSISQERALTTHRKEPVLIPSMCCVHGFSSLVCRRVATSAGSRPIKAPWRIDPQRKSAFTPRGVVTGITTVSGMVSPLFGQSCLHRFLTKHKSNFSPDTLTSYFFFFFLFFSSFSSAFFIAPATSMPPVEKPLFASGFFIRF